MYWKDTFGRGFCKQLCPTFRNLANWILILIHLNIKLYELLPRRRMRAFTVRRPLRNIRTMLSDTPLASLMWLSVEVQWHGPRHLWIRHPSRHVTTLLRSFLHLILCLSVVIDFCLKERYRRGSERSSAAWRQFRMCRKAQHSDIQVCLERREKATSFHIHQTPNLSSRGRWPAHAQIPSRERIQSPSFIGKEIQDNFSHCGSLNVGVWYSEAIFNRPLGSRRHIIPLCKCGKFSKACEL